MVSNKQRFERIETSLAELSEAMRSLTSQSGNHSREERSMRRRDRRRGEDDQSRASDGQTHDQRGQGRQRDQRTGRDMRDERRTRERDEDNANQGRQGGTCRRAAPEERHRGDRGLNSFTLNPNPFRRDGSESDNNDKSEEQTDGSESQCQSLLAISDDFEGQLFFYEEYDDSFSQGHGYSGPPVFDSDTSENKLGDAFFGDYIGTQIYDEEIVLQSDDPIFYKEIGDTCVEVFHGSCDVGEEYETEPVYDEDGEGKQEEEVEVEFNQLHACTVKSAMHLMDAGHSREVKSLLTEFSEVTSQSKILPSLLTEFPEVTSQSKTLCPQCEFDHRICLINETKPVNVAQYRYAHFQKDEIERPVEKMLYTGLIRHNMSPFLSPILLVKKDDTWRFCTNYRALNAAAVKDRFHIPTVDDMLGELRGARDFSKLDLWAGYHQIHMHPDGIHKTAFRTHIENTVAKIIWDEVGESKAERDRALAELERECSEVFRRKVGQANRCRAQLRQAIADAEAELATICSAMGELPVHIRQSDQIPQSLKAELRTILPQIEEMRKREVDRKNQFIQILREIQSIKNETGRSDPLGSNELAIDNADLSTNKLEELQAHKGKSKHLKMTLHRLNCLYSLCIVLGLDCKKIVYKIHPSLVEAESSKNISKSTIEQLGTAIQELRELKIQRMQQLQNLATSLLEFWNLMDTPTEEQQMFQKVTYTLAASEDEITEPDMLSIDNINHVAAEVSRLEELKASKMKEGVLKMKVELEVICRKTRLIPDTNNAIKIAINAIEFGAVDAACVLDEIELKIAKVKEEVLSRKEILEKVEKWMAACEEESWLEECNRDDNQYNARRGAHLTLKRGENARAWVNQLPAMVDVIQATLLPYSEEGTQACDPAKVLDYRWVHRKGIAVREALVQWENLEVDDATWEMVDELRDKFPTFNLEDKVLLEDGGDVRTTTVGSGLQVYTRKRKRIEP